ncbi:MAG: hypothetical protein M1538_00700 [Candidatus Marsarchaeota archaeon]|nr:hypothetical protein [Candidatus Marsarchaeota archaeon]
MELNESKLIKNEITLRRMAITKEVTETRRSLVRWLALAMGIINPGESRLSAVEVFDALIYFHFTSKKNPTVNEIAEYINVNWEPINEKTLRYHLLQLSKANIVEHSKGKYSLIYPLGEEYDEIKWLDYYFKVQIEPIKESISNILLELKTKI